MMRAMIVAAVVMCLASSAYTAVGDLTCKACDARDGWMARMPPSAPPPADRIAARGEGPIRPAPAGCGTVNPAAKVITLKTPTGTLLVALDSAKADDKVLDVLRIDVTGKGQFTAAAFMPIKWPKDDGTGSVTFGPVTLKVTRDGREMAVAFRGNIISGAGGVTKLR